MTFYLRPMPSTSNDPRKPWYYSCPVGKNVISSMLKNMCSIAGIESHKTNHSLRATGATDMFRAGVPEKIIQQRTGHLSLKALGEYERTTDAQQKAVCGVLHSSDPSTSYNSMLSSSLCDSTVKQQDQRQCPKPSAFSASSACTNVYNNCIFNMTVERPPVDH